MALELTTKFEYKTDTGRVLVVGDKVEYLCHIPGGWVNIRFADGTEEFAHPKAFLELQ